MTAMPKVIVQYDKVRVVHATAGPQGAPGEPGPEGPPGQDAELPTEWVDPPDLTLLFENGMV